MYFAEFSFPIYLLSWWYKSFVIEYVENEYPIIHKTKKFVLFSFLHDGEIYFLDKSYAVFLSDVNFPPGVQF